MGKKKESINPDFYKDNFCLLIRKENYLSPKEKAFNKTSEENGKNISKLKSKLKSLKPDSPLFQKSRKILSDKTKLKFNSINNKSISNYLLPYNNKDNIHRIKTMKNSFSENGYNINLKENNYRNIFIDKKYEFAYDKFLSYKKKNFVLKKKQYLEEIKNKYFIRGLALNKEYAFYYNECKKVDFLEKEEEKKTGNKSIYSNIISCNKNNFDYSKYKSKSSNKNLIKPKKLLIRIITLN